MDIRPCHFLSYDVAYTRSTSNGPCPVLATLEGRGAVSDPAAGLCAALPARLTTTTSVLQARAEKMGLVLPGAGLPGLRDAPPYEYELLHASKELASLASSRSIDIVKKPSTQAKKPRYLLMLPGKFAALDGGEIGSIERCVVCTRAAAPAIVASVT